MPTTHANMEDVHLPVRDVSCDCVIEFDINSLLHRLIAHTSMEKMCAIMMIGAIGMQDYIWCTENKMLRQRYRDLLKTNTHTAVTALFSMGVLAIRHVPLIF